MNVELLLSSHPDDCLYCERNGNCELQKLAEDLNVRNRKISGNKSEFKIDNSSHGIVRDQAKCILCGRCVRICEEIVGTSSIDFETRGDRLRISTAMNEPLSFSSCIDCGMCVVSCPTGALIDKTEYQELDIYLDDSDKKIAVQYTPDVAVSIAEEFGFKAGTDLKGIINNALRKIGFDFIFETAYAADAYILEAAQEYKKRLEQNDKLPLILSRCPAWVNYVEEFRPDLISHLLPVRSPHQIMGKLINTWFAESNNIPHNRLFTVLVTNCTAAKHEARRPDYTTDKLPDIDFVLSTRELARLIRLHGIDMHQLEPVPSDGPFFAQSSAGKLFAVAGGELEATLRTVYKEITKKELSDLRINKLRGGKEVKEVSLKGPKKEITAASVSGLKNAIRLLNDVCNGKCQYDLMEIMVCPDGCVNGGGKTISSCPDWLKARSKSIYDMDKSDAIRVAHKNAAVQKCMKHIPMNQEALRAGKSFWSGLKKERFLNSLCKF